MDTLAGPFRSGLIVLALTLGASLAPLSAQQTGSIRIEVKDATGKALEASGKLVNPAGNIDKTFQTNDEGEYYFLDLPFGHYTLQVSKTGFPTRSLELDVKSHSKPVSRIIWMLKPGKSPKAQQ